MLIGPVVHQASPWIQMNFYPNPDGPALLSVLLEVFYSSPFQLLQMLQREFFIQQEQKTIDAITSSSLLFPLR
jgi:hypothetical protein